MGEGSLTAQVNALWAHYVNETGSRRSFDEKRKRIMRTALKTMARVAREHGETDPSSWALARCKLAVTGLSRSPWHHGENPEGKKYLEIRYALRGIGDESDDERIDKMCDVAAVHDPRRDRVDPVKVERWLDHVRYTAQRPHSERDRALAALHNLREAGFTVTRINRAPWVVIA